MRLFFKYKLIYFFLFENLCFDFLLLFLLFFRWFDPLFDVVFIWIRWSIFIREGCWYDLRLLFQILLAPIVVQLVTQVLYLMKLKCNIIIVCRWFSTLLEENQVWAKAFQCCFVIIHFLCWSILIHNPFVLLYSYYWCNWTILVNVQKSNHLILCVSFQSFH